MLGDVRRLGLPGLEEAGHLGVQLPRDRRRHGAQCGFEDQVVRERALAQNLRGVELAPGVAQVDRAQAEHVRGELGAEVGAGDRGAAGQLHRHRREPADALLDQVGDVRGGRQAGRDRPGENHRARRHGRWRQHQLQRLEQEHRVAAGVAGQRRCQTRRLERGDAERIDQRADVVGGERLQHLQAGAVNAEQQVVEGLRRRRQLVGPEGDDPAQAEAGRCELLHRFDAGRVGELQVVDDEAGHALGLPLAQGRLDRGDETRIAGVAPGRRAAELRQQVREFAGDIAGERFVQAGQQQAQQTRQQRMRHPCIARPRVDRERAGLSEGEIRDQPGLAEAGLAGDQARMAGRPVGVQALPLGVATDQARRAQHAHRQRPRLRQVGRQAAGGDAGAQRLGFAVGGDAERSLEHVAAAVERSQRGGPVAAEIVQAHQAPMRVLGSRVEVDQALRGGQRGDQLARHLEPGRLVGEGTDAAGAALLAGQREPLGELADKRLFEAVQELARVGFGMIEVDLDVGAEAGDVAAFEQLATERLAQAEQALAQIGAGPLGVDVGPEQRGQPAARRRPFDRQVGQQQRVLLLERADPAVGTHELRLAGEVQGVGAGRGSGHGRGREFLEAEAHGSSITGLRGAA